MTLARNVVQGTPPGSDVVIRPINPNGGGFIP